jgi:serine/threonine-protein kinase
MSENAPKKYGKCKVVRTLGHGATATVYLAKHEGLDMSVAVKVLRKKLSETRPEYAERFLREARTAAWLEHPNIVRVIDCGVEQGYHFMVMDYVDGPNCLEELHKHSDGLDWREATRIVQQAATGLAYAASKEVIHRDVKPSNIMIDSTGRVRVTDLGLAKLTIKGIVSLTQELHTVGTPNYMSPEQIRSPAELDLRTDIYSLGATFYHLVTGRPPFTGTTPMEVVAQHLSSPVVAPSKVKPQLPESVSSVICKMMAKSPTERYQNWGDLSKDLENLLEGKPTMVEGFEDTESEFEDAEELKQLLDELSFVAPIKVEREEKEQRTAERPKEAATAVKDEKGSTELALFGRNEVIAYPPSVRQPGESTVLSRARIERRQSHIRLIVALVVGGVIALLAFAVLVALLNK